MKLIKIILLLLMAVSGIVANNDIKVFVEDNTDKKITPKIIEDIFEKSGFVIAVNNNMLVPFVKKFKTTPFEVYNLFGVFRKDTVLALAKDYPEVGLVSPMTMSIYTKKGDKTISVAHLSGDTIAKIMGVPANHPAIIKLSKDVEDTLKKIMPNGKHVKLNYKSAEHKEDIVTRTTVKLIGDDIEDAKDDFQMKFESALAKDKFVSAGFSDLNFDLEESDKEWYTFYDVYSVCKISVIYNISKSHPEAGALGPCSMYMYQKNGEDSVHIAFTNVYKWIEALNIQDKESLDILIDAQNKFENILTKLGKK